MGRQRLTAVVRTRAVRGVRRWQHGRPHDPQLRPVAIPVEPWLEGCPSALTSPVAATARVVASALRRLDLLVPASVAARIAARLRPTAAGLTELGLVLQQGADLRPTPVFGVGVLPRPGPSDGARRAFELAVAGGGGPSASAGLLEDTVRRGRLDEAYELARIATTVHSESPTAWHDLGRVVAEQGHRAGGLTTAQVEEIDAAWQTALDCAADRHPATRYRLLRHRIRFQRWDDAFALVGPRGGTTPTPERLVAERDVPEDVEWMFCAMWRLLADGRHADAARFRTRRAELTLGDLDWPLATESTVGAHVGALVALDRTAEAADLVERARTELGPRLAIDRWDADLALRRGDTEPLRRLARRWHSGLPAESERRFASLLGGSRVAVFAPASNTEVRDAAAARHDVLVDTKRLRAGPGRGHPSISYYSDSSWATFRGSITALTNADPPVTAVLRPSSIRNGGWVPPSSRIRVAPFEDSLLPVSHLGVARAVHDVLRYAPATLRLHDVDMFTAAMAYPPDYLSDEPRYDEFGFVPVLPRFDHDLVDDFRFISALADRGRIDLDDTTADVVGAGLDGYLDRLDRAAATR